MEFLPFPKIARLNREIVITEKIDGTNAQVFITPHILMDGKELIEAVAIVGDFAIYAGSRTRWITPQSDNYGFAKWVKEHAEELSQLGPGQHFGEWWGQGIQRKYGLSEKRFSLFNTGRWVERDRAGAALQPGQQEAPGCCHVVPVITRGLFRTEDVNWAVEDLRKNGSMAAPGFMDPEGIVVWHSAAQQLFKVTLKNDEVPKGNHGV